MIRKIIAENAIYRSDAITGTFLKNGYDEMGLPWSNVYISFCGDKKKTKSLDLRYTKVLVKRLICATN